MRGNFDCKFNKLENMNYLPEKVGGVFNYRGNEELSAEMLDLDLGRLHLFLRNKMLNEVLVEGLLTVEEVKRVSNKI